MPRPRVQGQFLKGGLQLHLKPIAAHQAGPQATGQHWAGLAVLMRAYENLCSPARAAPILHRSNGIMQDNVDDHC